MRVYHERLRVPVSWWVLGVISVLMLGAGFLAGFDWEPALAVYGILTAGLAAILIGWGRLRTEVADGELRVGRDRLPLALAGEVTAPPPSPARDQATVIRQPLSSHRYQASEVGRLADVQGANERWVGHGHLPDPGITGPAPARVADEPPRGVDRPAPPGQLGHRLRYGVRSSQMPPSAADTIR